MVSIKLNQFKLELEKAGNRRAYHNHDKLLPSHPVRVKDHPAWFAHITQVSNTQKIQKVIRNEPKLQKVLNVLSKHGTPYMVGGSVRDIILGKSAKDFDIEVYGIEVDKLAKILESELGAKPQQVGKQFGVFKFEDFDISLPRKETKIGEKHTDFDVEFDANLTPQEGARRRDFTINALMYNPKTREINDFFGGLKDLENKQLKHIDDKTFVEDALRVYRAAQFAGRFGFTIHPATQKLASSIDLSHLPPERLYEEFKKLFLKSPKPSIGIQALDAMEVIDKYYPEVAVLKTTEQRPDYHAEGTVWIHTLMVIDKAAQIIKNFRLEQDQKTIMLAAFCHDFGKPSTTKISDKGFPVQPGHEEAGVEPTLEFLKKLTTETDTIADVSFLVAHHLLPMHSHRNELNDAGFRRMINKYGLHRLKLLAAVSRADVTGRLHRKEDGTVVEPNADEIDWFENKIKEISESLGTTMEGKITPLITGNDLIGVGFKEGPELGKVLQVVRSKQEEGILTNKPEAMKFVKENFVTKSALQQFKETLEKQEGIGGGVGGTTYAGGTVMGTEQSTTTFGGNEEKKKKNKLFNILSQVTKKSEPTETIFEAYIGNKKFILEMTQNRQKGLGGREILEEGHGMIFPFRGWWPAKMTMNNMNFPLDFIIVGENEKVIQIEENVQPKENIVLTFPPCRMIIEVNAGEAQGIQINDIVSGVYFFDNYLVKQLGEAPGAQQARQQGLVPQSGNWKTPVRWVRPKGVEGENKRVTQEQEKESKAKFFENIKNSFDFREEANKLEEIRSNLPKRPNIQENYTSPEQERINEAIRDEWTATGFIGEIIRELALNLDSLEKIKTTTLEAYEFKMGEDGKLEALAVINEQNLIFYVDTVVTMPSQYKKPGSSAGTKLMMDIMHRFLTNSKANIIVTHPLNKHVRKYYEKFGFKSPMGLEYGSVEMTKEDAKKAYNNFAKRFKMDLVKQETTPDYLLNDLKELIKLEEDVGVLAKRTSKEEKVSKQMLAPDHRLSFETYYPPKTGYKGESDFVRELAEAGKLNEAVTTGKTLEERKMNLKEELDKTYKKQEQEIVTTSGCHLCEDNCTCIEVDNCACEHDCFCAELEAYRIDNRKY